MVRMPYMPGEHHIVAPQRVERPVLGQGIGYFRDIKMGYRGIITAVCLKNGAVGVADGNGRKMNAAEGWETR